MKLNDFNKELKKEYHDNIDNQPRKQKKILFNPLFIFGVIVLFIVSAFAINKIYVSNFNNSLIQKLSSNFDTAEKLIKINSGYELSNYSDNEIKVSWIDSIFNSVSMKNTGIEPNNDIAAGTSPMTSINTNVREKEIDEADIAKCDGKYIYYLYKVDYVNYVLQIYDLNSNLIVSQNIHYYAEKNQYYNVRGAYPGDIKCFVKDNKIIIEGGLFIRIYDFTNNILTLETEFYGKFNESRLYDNIYYFIGFIGWVNENIDYNNLYYDGYSIPKYVNRMYKYNLDSKEIDTIDMVSSGYTIYMNQDYIVLTSKIMKKQWIEDKKISYDGPNLIGDISVFSVFDTGLNPICVFKAAGIIINSYAIDIKDNKLRVVTTNVSYEKEKCNNLVIFDIKEKMRLSIIDNNLGEGYESVKSVRFEGDKCFVVTYRTTDPLYEIDLNDMNNPVIVDSYKAPGYSGYLHYLTINGNDYVLGLGYIDTYNSKISLYKDEDTNIQIGKDYLIENQIIVSDSHAYRIITSNEDNCIYLGLPYSKVSYIIYKIDVLTGNVSIHKEYVVDNYTRSFIIDSVIYIPTTQKLIVDNL